VPKNGVKTLALSPLALRSTHMPHFTAHCAGSGSPEGRARRGRYALESVALEVASFGFGITIIEPGGARTEFHYGGARVAKHMPIYDQTPAHSFLRMLDPKDDLAPGGQERTALGVTSTAFSVPDTTTCRSK
jgi:hypothetical protein